MQIYLASFILFLALLLPSCREQNVTDTSKQGSLDGTQDVKSNWKLSYDIINTVLPELISTQSYTKNPKNTLFVYPKHISIDSVLAQELIARGANNDQVYSICYPKSPCVGFNTKEINDCESFGVCRIIPMTTSELENNIGTIAFSEVIISSHRDSASFLYSFHKTFDRRNSILSHVELSIKEDIWVIDSTIHLKRKGFRIIEN